MSDFINYNVFAAYALLLNYDTQNVNVYRLTLNKKELCNCIDLMQI